MLLFVGDECLAIWEKWKLKLLCGIFWMVRSDIWKSMRIQVKWIYGENKASERNNGRKKCTLKLNEWHCYFLLYVICISPYDFFLFSRCLCTFLHFFSHSPVQMPQRAVHWLCHWKSKTSSFLFPIQHYVQVLFCRLILPSIQ